LQRLPRQRNIFFFKCKLSTKYKSKIIENPPQPWPTHYPGPFPWGKSTIFSNHYYPLQPFNIPALSCFE